MGLSPVLKLRGGTFAGLTNGLAKLFYRGTMFELIDFRLMHCLDIVPISLKWPRCRQLMIRRYLETCIDKDRLNNKTISDRWIKLFIKQCPCCQLRSRAHLAIRTHPFTCAAKYPFEVLALDHIGPAVIDEKGYKYALVLIDAFSRWVEYIQPKEVNADETAKCIFQHLGHLNESSLIVVQPSTMN